MSLTLPRIIPNDIMQAYYRALVLCGQARSGDKQAAQEIVKIASLEPPITREQLGLNRFEGRNTDPEDLHNYMLQVFQSQMKP